MLKPVEQRFYRIRYYFAAVAAGIGIVHVCASLSAKGSAQTGEFSLTPETLPKDFNVSHEKTFTLNVSRVGLAQIAPRNALDLLQPLTKKLLKIVSLGSEMSPSVPVTSNSRSERTDPQRSKGELSGVKFELRHLLAWGISSFLVGLTGYLWGRHARLEKPYRIGGNTSYLVLVRKAGL